MRRVTAVLSLVLAVVVTSVALAAVSPKKGGLYKGSKSGTVVKVISFKVSTDGKSGVADLYCSGQHVGRIRHVAITRGTFFAKKMVGSSVVWSVKGSFTSRTLAIAKANFASICDGVGGTFRLKLVP